MTEEPVPYHAAKPRIARPTGNRLLVVKLDQRRKPGSLVHIPDHLKQEDSTEFLVKAVGPGRRSEEGKLVPMEIKVGDHVVVGKYSGTQTIIEDVHYYVIREEDVLMVLE